MVLPTLGTCRGDVEGSATPLRSIQDCAVEANGRADDTVGRGQPAIAPTPSRSPPEEVNAEPSTSSSARSVWRLRAGPAKQVKRRTFGPLKLHNVSRIFALSMARRAGHRFFQAWNWSTARRDSLRRTLNFPGFKQIEAAFGISFDTCRSCASASSQLSSSSLSVAGPSDRRQSGPAMLPGASFLDQRRASVPRPLSTAWIDG